MPETMQTLQPPDGWSAETYRQDLFDTRYQMMKLDFSAIEQDDTGDISLNLLLESYVRLQEWGRELDVCLTRMYYDEAALWDGEYSTERQVVYKVQVDTDLSFDRSCWTGRQSVSTFITAQWIGGVCEDCSCAAEIGESRCQSCQEEYNSCCSCGEEMHREDAYYDYNDDAYCSYCWQDRDDDFSSPDEQEEQDTLADRPTLTADNLGFEARYFNPARGDQLTSVELEFGRDPEGVAYALYDAGLSSARSVGGYHEAARRNRGSAYVEYDGSVGGGGEMVISMLGLPGEQETLRLWHTVKVLRDRVHAGDNNLNMHCGCHIHVNALGRDLNSIISTVVAYNHIEDILYRISAANYKYHRLDNGNDYATQTEKMITDKDRFRASFGTRRYYGLNVGNYLSYRHDCNCGAGFDNASQCVCDPSTFYKPTLEFRLFNTTANGVKLHAFIAICQALVFYGTNRELLSRDLEPMEYSTHHRPYSAAEYVERLLWMLVELPFSAEERNSIRYCIRNSSLKDVLEQGVANGEVDADAVQAILHEDELLNLGEYRIPERPEEAVPAVSRTRVGWVTTPYWDRYGTSVLLDPAGRYRDAVTGRYATPVNMIPEQPPVTTSVFDQAVEAYFHASGTITEEDIEF